MPDFTAHHLLGEEVRRRLPPGGREVVSRAPSAFFWGLQGPDPLFYGGRQLSRCGSGLHQKSPEKLLRLLFLQAAHARGERREILESYLLGFLCHYAMDARLHPYVYCMEQRLRRVRPQKWWPSLHGEIECRMDEQLYRLLRKKPVIRFSPDSYRLDSKTLAALCRLYQLLFYGMFGLRIAPDRIAAAFQNCLQISRLVYTAPARIGRPALELLEYAAGWPGIFSSHVKFSKSRGGDILNLRHAAWQDFSQPFAGHSESVPELFEQAAKDACSLCRVFLAALWEGRPPLLPPLPAFDAGNFKR
ncbi:MAG: hypothetical protein HFG27_03020 [Provencibacterium sp.]|nr:hypothetical protein [Provencibacterium sp.]